ncbi:MAG: insulinase family protein [Polyangiaceae bacterium]|nr:insulinase family protein [Polyangiaceae bacterium]
MRANPKGWFGRRAAWAIAAPAAIAALGWAPRAEAQTVDIPFIRGILPNGLIVILSEDHSVPQVAVNVSFSVGSRFERGGRTGFAHLFEHLMFMGTRRAPTRAFDAWMEGAGGRNNAWTAEDRTDYFDIAPPTALPLLLWLEADRMRDLGPLIDQAKLDLQRDVVRNERRQSIENRPYGVEELELPKLLWPEAHPYHHPVIGSHGDLEAALVGDVKDFFSTWYDPANASIVVAGDFDPQEARALVVNYFSSVPTRGKPQDPGAPGFSDEKSTLSGVVRQTVTDDVELAKVVLAWQSPRHFAAGDAELDLLASVLSQGKGSRLYKALVYDQKIAQAVSARQESHVLGSDFVVEALARPGVDPSKLERALFDQIAQVRAAAVAADELERARNGYEMDFVDRLQSIPERASLLNAYQAELGDPGYAQRDLDRYRRASAADVLAVAKRVLLPDAVVSLTIIPRAAQKPEKAAAPEKGR